MSAVNDVLFDRLGLGLVVRHDHIPLASVRALARNREQWNRPLEYLGIDYRSSRSHHLAEELKAFTEEALDLKYYNEAVKARFGPGFGPVEAVFLHAYLRWKRPTRYLEIGCGVSTYCAFKALACNESQDGVPARMTLIEPNPSSALRNLSQNDDSITLLEMGAEEVDLAAFDSIAPDFVFIDSTHTVRPAGDLSRIYLELIPRLQPGTTIHIHDIGFPYTFLPNLLQSGFSQWAEPQLLWALLIGNRKLRMELCQADLFHSSPEVYRKLIPWFEPAEMCGGLRLRDGHYPASTYLSVC